MGESNRDLYGRRPERDRGEPERVSVPMVATDELRKRIAHPGRRVTALVRKIYAKNWTVPFRRKDDREVTGLASRIRDGILSFSSPLPPSSEETKASQV